MKSMNDVDHALHQLIKAANTDYIGEPISQLEHALQCAYFAEKAKHSDDVILACLFHDIGHFASETKQHQMAELGIVNHEWIGAKLALGLGFSAKVALLIAYHVDAKRYLAYAKKDYYLRLSSASKQTLTYQGGPMRDEEALTFAKHPYFKEILQVRINDEKAKEIGLTVPGIEYYYDKIKNHFANVKASHPLSNDLPDFVDAIWVQRLKQNLEKQFLI